MSVETCDRHVGFRFYEFDPCSQLFRGQNSDSSDNDLPRNAKILYDSQCRFPNFIQPTGSHIAGYGGNFKKLSSSITPTNTDPSFARKVRNVKRLFRM